MTTLTNTAPRSTFNPSALAASLANTAAKGPTNGQSNDSTPRANIFLAIGTLRDGIDINAEDFQGIDPVHDLINLPQMQGLDNMKPDDRRASTQEFADSQAERNEFLEDLVTQAMASTQPGETRIMPFYVTLYRKKDEVVAAPKAARTSRSFFGA